MLLYANKFQKIELNYGAIIRGGEIIGKVVTPPNASKNYPMVFASSKFQNEKQISNLFKKGNTLHIQEYFGERKCYHADAKHNTLLDDNNHIIATYSYESFIPENCGYELRLKLIEDEQNKNAQKALMAYVANEYYNYVAHKSKFIYLMNLITFLCVIPVFILIYNQILKNAKIIEYLNKNDTGMWTCVIVSILIGFAACAISSFLIKPNFKASISVYWYSLIIGYNVATIVTLISLFKNDLEFTGFIIFDFLLCFLAPILGLIEFAGVLLFGLIFMFFILLIKYIGIILILK